MTTLPRLDYAANDFSTFLQNLEDFMETELPEDTFNDFIASQLMMFMLRMNAYIGGVQSWKLDKLANENFLVTAEQRRSIIRFANSVGYKLSPATAASVTVTVVLPSPNAQDIVVRDGTTFSVDALTFEIDQDYTLTAGSLTMDMGATEGNTITQDFASNGSKNQRFELSQFPVVKDSIVQTVDDVLWTEFDFIAFASSTDKAYVVSLDEDDRATIETGDGAFGEIPPNGSTVRFVYRVGGGEDGNIAQGAINTTIAAYLDDITLTSVPIVNNSPASGGSDSESIEHAKLFIPKSLKTIDHAVTDDDYDTLASGFSSPSAGTVAKANAVLRGGELNKIDIFIWTRLPDGSLTGASLALRNALRDYMVVRNVISHDVAVFSGVTQSVDLEADVVYQASKTETEMETALDAAVGAFFNATTLNPGDDIYLSDLYNLIVNVDGVQSLIFLDPTGNVTIADDKIAVLGTTTWNLTPAELGT